ARHAHARRRGRRCEQRGKCDEGESEIQVAAGVFHEYPPPNFAACRSSPTAGESSSVLKKFGWSTTPFAASLSLKCGLRPVHFSGASKREVRLSAACASSGGFATKMSCR